ncbi:hypothetical protein [Vibrio neptunius]|uniref:Uncharacterized protein n=1 Tax=Vibrio neptunius TaxID=170651 RepID=A0ABS2ZW29_9VIBR|nr:hypothetical protein [Vibrio neptunius]MBN3494586.1 hypothetical protein [Vibrio neptunius]MBN3513654.1 hypothetical protein [Vibrio neptunius]MBN3547995.1 hypothetical protein [Vibrio neptunius]MBN3576418.1 hypothetical protein [Vibrio neptunius]MCH9870082.1 hypothetical protein [Vibrio neptunius]
MNTFVDEEGQTEGLIVSGLAYDLMTKTQPSRLKGYVAKQDNIIIGCNLFSKMTFESSVNPIYCPRCLLRKWYIARVILEVPIAAM